LSNLLHLTRGKFSNPVKVELSQEVLLEVSLNFITIPSGKMRKFPHPVMNLWKLDI